MHLGLLIDNNQKGKLINWGQSGTILNLKLKPVKQLLASVWRTPRILFLGSALLCHFSDTIFC